MVSPAYYLRLVGKKVKIGARASKKLRGVAGKRFRAPAPPLLVAAPTSGASPAAVAARGPAGLAASVAAVGAASAVVAALGPAAAGLAAGVAVASEAMATAGAAAPGGPVRRLGRHPLVLGGRGLQLPGV
jgi:hypothetical protein